MWHIIPLGNVCNFYFFYTDPFKLYAGQDYNKEGVTDYSPGSDLWIR